MEKFNQNTVNNRVNETEGLGLARPICVLRLPLSGTSSSNCIHCSQILAERDLVCTCFMPGMSHLQTRGYS